MCVVGHHYCALFSSSSTASSSSTIIATTTPIVELQEIHVKPSQMKTYMEMTERAVQVCFPFLPLRLVSTPDTGDDLFVATQALYYQNGHAERNDLRAELQKEKAWTAYMDNWVLPNVTRMQSSIFVEAPLVAQYDTVPGLASAADANAEPAWTYNDKQNNNNTNNNSNCILELRRYKLQLGYDTVPKFLEFYGNGLPSKLDAPGTDPTTSLVTLLYSDVGRLNEVIEVWQHGNGTSAMERSRMAARGAQEWRSAIASIAGLAIEFRSSIHKPASFSPLR